MSTRYTIKHGDGFHVWQDWIDECVGQDLVHLRLDDVAFEASSPGTVEVSMPRALAEAIGIVASRRTHTDKLRDALAALETATEAVAAGRSQAAYDQMIADGQDDALLALDNARGMARAALNGDPQ